MCRANVLRLQVEDFAEAIRDGAIDCAAGVFTPPRLRSTSVPKHLAGYNATVLHTQRPNSLCLPERDKLRLRFSECRGSAQR